MFGYTSLKGFKRLRFETVLSNLTLDLSALGGETTNLACEAVLLLVKNSLLLGAWSCIILSQPFSFPSSLAQRVIFWGSLTASAEL